jgi:hypothetical protein
VASYDVFAPREPVDWKLEALQDWGRLICYGRPGWNALYKGGANLSYNPYAYENLIQFARTKLIAGTDPTFTTWPPEFPNLPPSVASELVRTMEIALLSRRALVCIGRRTELARTLVASCMAVCVDVSEDFESMLVESLSEPILSEAAARLIHKYKLWPTLLQTLVDAIRLGTVESGRLGELAAWILLSIAWDAACIAKFQDRLTVKTFTRSDVSLGDFLKALLGYVPAVDYRCNRKRTRNNNDPETAEKNALDVARDLMKWRVCFTHMIQISRNQVSLESLQVAACRMGMTISAPGTAAVDATLPLFPPSGGKFEELGSVQFQIRNLFEPPSSLGEDCLRGMQEVARKMAEGGLCGIDIVLHVGDKRLNHTSAEFFMQSGSNRACLVLSTDARLTLFKHAIQTVTQTSSTEGAEILHSLFQKLIDAERLVSFRDQELSIRNSHQNPYSLIGAENVTLFENIEQLRDVFLLAKNKPTEKAHKLQQAAVPSEHANQLSKQTRKLQLAKTRQKRGKTSGKNVKRSAKTTFEDGTSEEAQRQPTKKRPKTIKTLGKNLRCEE